MTETSLWVFGYGSLVWNPGFDFMESQIARLQGYHRSFCMWSFHYRGTRNAPGLVLALDEMENGHCDGVAFRIAAGKIAGTLSYLRKRELISNAYIEAEVPLVLRDGRRVRAVTYVVNRDHEQYCTETDPEKLAGIIASAVGKRGRNIEYLENTVRHLNDLGLRDAALDHLAGRAKEMAEKSA